VLGFFNYNTSSTNIFVPRHEIKCCNLCIFISCSAVFSLLPFREEKSRLMRSPSCIYLCLSHLSTFELVSSFSEIQWGGHAIEIDLHTIIFNLVASTIQKLRAFKLLRWMQNLPQSSWDREILYADRSSEDKQR
jgi:hypothetical protein